MRDTLSWGALLLVAGLVQGGQAADRDPESLFEFDRDTAGEWMIVNDGVMGGLSSSRFMHSDSGFATFAGELSLANNGGFASVRALVPAGVLADRATLVLRVRGDGRTYQVRLRTDREFDGIAYMTEFHAPEGEWREVVLPLTDFQPTFRGRRPRGAPPLSPADVQQIGLLLADKRPGSFRLDVAWIRAS